MAQAIQDREYQGRAVDAVFREWSAGVPSTLLVLPTGTGKTIIAGRVIRRFKEEQGGQILFVAHRDTLIRQAVARFSAMGLNASVEQAGSHARRDFDGLFANPDVVVASVQSLQGERLASWPADSFGAVIVDECHHSNAPTHRNVIAHFGSGRLLGITATPDASDRANLGEVYRTKCYEYALLDAIHEGWLCGIDRRTCLTQVDLRAIRSTAGDYNLGDLAERICPHVEELADETMKHTAGRQTAIFTPDVGSAIAFAQVLRLRGATAKYVSGSGGKFGMPQADRDRVLGEYSRDEFQYIVSCELLFEGWDCPQVKGIVIARPTKKRYRYAQMLGRGLRRYNWEDPGETCVLVDFDWQQDTSSKDLARVIDLFADASAEPWVVNYARRRMENGQDDPVKALAEAEHAIRVHQKFLISLTGRTSNCKVLTADPIAMGQAIGVKLHNRVDLDLKGVNPATENQIRYLQSLGLRGAADMHLSKYGASRLIDPLKRRRDEGYASPKQIARLHDEGVDREMARMMSIEQAARALKEIEEIRFGKADHVA